MAKTNQIRKYIWGWVVFALLFTLFHFPASSQPDLPNPPADLQTVTQGSLVIPMDNNNQNIGNPFNLKAYGLVHALLMDDIPVKWVIKSGKAKDSIDFSATAERIYPSFVAATTVNFSASAFIIDSVYINNSAEPWGQSATQIITTFGNNVAVFKLTQDVVVDVRYTLDFRPKIAVFSNGGNEAVHQAILDAAGVTNYYIINAGVFPGISECYTFCSEPHWAGGPADTTITYIIRDYVQDGGNFLAQCKGVDTYENLNYYHTDSGIIITNEKPDSNLYFNPDMAYMQFDSIMKANEGGSEKNWTYGPTSVWDPNFYHCMSAVDTDTIVAAAAHLIHPDSAGGNVYYLGGHDYSPFNDILQINAARVYLNASLVPAGRPSPFTVDMGTDTTICQGDSIVLGGSPTAPVGTNYFWSPGTTLNDSTLANPTAFPTDTTVYILNANNGGCSSQGAVTVSVTLAPVSNAGVDQTVCGDNPAVTLNGSVINAPGGIWTGNGGAFSPDSTSLSTVYTPSPLEIATGSSMLVLSTTGPCNPVNDTIIITITPIVTVDAGPDQIICFGSSDVTITATAAGGDSSYSYLWNTADTTQSITVGVGTYSVTVTDVSGCAPAQDTVAVTFFSSAITVDAGTDTSLCVDFLPVFLSGTVTTATGGTWSGGSGTYSPSNDSLNITYMPSAAEITAGNATLVLTTTGNGTCPAESDTVLITIADFNATVSVTTSNVSCSGNMAYITTSGGTPPFTVTWGTAPPQAGDTIVNIPAGSYNVTVTNGNGCDSVLTFSITEPPLLQSTISNFTNVNCFGANTGTATVVASGGTPAYTFQWDASASSQTDSTATGLGAGTYSVTVTDNMGCVDDTTVTITQPAIALSISITFTNVICFGGVDGTATVIPSGGIVPYTYQWDAAAGSQTTSLATGLSTGVYAVTVTDNNSCTDDTVVTISQPASSLILNSTVTNVSCFGGADGTSIVSTSGGTSPYTFLWSDPGAQTDSTATGLSAGNYMVTVTDFTGDCQVDTSIVVTEPAAPISLIISSTGVSCFSGNNGTATVIASGGTAPYTYSWNNGDNTATTDTLAAGTFAVTVTDLNSCLVTDSVVIVDPPILTAAISAFSNVTCNAGNDGSATVTAGGGTLPYTYNWNDPASQTDTSATGLLAGTYSVTITDTNGCTVDTSVTISQPVSALTLISTVVNVSCNGGNDGSATVSASGGTSPYTYLWNDPDAQTDSTATGLLVGSYSVTVTDNTSDCKADTGIVVSEPPSLIVTSTASTDVSCNGGSDGTASTTPGGGTPAYVYLWNDSNSQTTTTATGLSAGSYSVTVTDNVGDCKIDTGIIVNEPLLPLTLSLSVTDIACFGGNGGMATVTASGGTTPYTYQWGASTGSQTDSTATGLSAGTYSVTVTDSNACTTADTSVAVTQPSFPLSLTTSGVDVSCFGGNNGSATTIVSGGTSPYTYAWSNGDNIATADSLIAGTFYVTVTDTNGCVLGDSASITEPAVLLTSTSQFNVSCNGGTDGGGTVLASGGISPYTYNWSSGGSSSTENSLTAGTYTITVTDSNGCTINDSVIISEPTALVLTTSTINVGCSGGTATVTVSGGTLPYTYAWSNGDNTAMIDTLAAGTYFVTVTDSNSCIATDSAVITLPALLSTSVTKTDVSCNGGVNGSATVTVSGGTLPYTYAWNNGDNAGTTDTLVAGNYFVTVTDSSGCIAMDSASIIQPAVLSASVTKSNASCNGSNDGSATVIASGGTSPYTYAWSNGDNTATTNVLVAGTYFVTVTDSNNCVVTDSAVITQPVALSALVIKTNISCNGNNDGSATATASGGTPPYTYAWSNGDSTATIDTLTAGTYTVAVNDSNNCSVVDSVVIIDPLILTATISASSNVSCTGGNDGSATVTAGGGTLPYTYSWNDPASQTDTSATGLFVGTYGVTVTDTNGCTADTSVTITQPVSALTLTSTVVNVSCNGGNDGSATVSVAGGTLPYTYLWSDPNSQTDSTATGLFAGSYSVTVTDNTGDCTVDTGIVVGEPLSLIVTSTSSTDVSCNGGSDGSATVAESGGTPPYTYLWNDADSQTTATATGLIVGTYSVTVTDSTGDCKIDTGIIVNEPLLPLSLSLTVTNVSCYGGNDGSATTTASGGTTPYTYQWDANAGSQTDSVATGLSTGTYSVSVTDSNGCLSVDTSVSIVQPVAPISLITSTIPVSCKFGNDGVANVNPSGGTSPYSYAWDDPGNQTNSAATGLLAGTYNVTVTDVNGCILTGIILVTEPILPLLVNLSSTATSCFGANDGTATVTATGGNSPYTYQWDSAAGNQTTAIAVALFAGSYSVSVTDSNGCTIAQSSIIVSEPPQLSFDSLVLTATDMCEGENAMVTGSYLGTDSSFSYSWNNGLGNSLGSFTVMPATTTTYILTVTDACANSIVDSAIVIVYNNPIISVDTLDYIGCVPLTVAFLNNAASPNDSLYLWGFGDGVTSNDISPVYEYTSSGTYAVSLIITSNQGCVPQNSAVGTVVVHALPQVSCSADPQHTDSRTPTINFTAGGTGTIFSWDFGDGDTSSTQNPVHTYIDIGTYTVTLSVIDVNQCKNSCQLDVIIDPYYEIVIPNGFTPNPNGPGDGTYDIYALNNDVFFVRTEFVDEFYIMIFNRWGEMVFDSDDINIGWDGYYMGEMCQQDAYAYKVRVKYIDGHYAERLGDITLVR